MPASSEEAIVMNNLVRCDLCDSLNNLVRCDLCGSLHNLVRCDLCGFGYKTGGLSSSSDLDGIQIEVDVDTVGLSSLDSMEQDAVPDELNEVIKDEYLRVEFLGEPH
jgi:hypothetical protein